MKRSTLLHPGYVSAGTTPYVDSAGGVVPDGCVLFLPAEAVGSVDITRVAPVKGEVCAPLPDCGPINSEGETGKVLPVSIPDGHRLCTTCGAPRPLRDFKRFYTAKQAIRMGYAKPNPRFGKDPDEPMYARVPKVEYESGVCLACRPQTPFYPKTYRGIAFAKVAGMVNPVIAEAKIKRMQEAASKARGAKSFLRTVKFMLRGLLSGVLAEEIESVRRRRRYVLSPSAAPTPQSLQDFADRKEGPADLEMPQQLWHEFLDMYEQALRIGYDRRGSVDDTDPAPNHYTPKGMFLKAAAFGDPGWGKGDEDMLLDLWAKRVCERAVQEEHTRPLGYGSMTRMERFVGAMQRALVAWHRALGAAQRNRTIPRVLGIMEKHMPERMLHAQPARKKGASPVRKTAHQMVQDWDAGTDE